MSGQTFSSLRHHQGQLTTPHELPTTTHHFITLQFSFVLLVEKKKNQDDLRIERNENTLHALLYLSLLTISHHYNNFSSYEHPNRKKNIKCLIREKNEIRN